MKRISRYVKETKTYTLSSDYRCVLPLLGWNYDSGFIALREGGELLVRAGYKWNGCSPKWEICDMVFGTPEGVLNNFGVPLTYYPSLVHDVLYQLGGEGVLPEYCRRRADGIFYGMLREEGFRMAWLYWLVVRLFGRKAWD